MCIRDRDSKDNDILEKAKHLPRFDFSDPGERLTVEGRQRLELRSIELYAQRLEIPLDKLLSNLDLMLAGRLKDKLPGED